MHRHGLGKDSNRQNVMVTADNDDITTGLLAQMEPHSIPTNSQHHILISNVLSNRFKLSLYVRTLESASVQLQMAHTHPNIFTKISSALIFLSYLFQSLYHVRIGKNLPLPPQHHLTMSSSTKIFCYNNANHLDVPHVQTISICPF